MATVVICLGCEKNDPQPRYQENPSTNYSDTIASNDVSKDVDANYDLPFVANIMDECPEKKCKIGNCKEGGAFAAMGLTSTCTKPCLGEEYGSGDLTDSELDNILCGDFTTDKCCGNITSEGEEASYWCLPEGKCCRPPKPVVCGDACCTVEETCNQETKICEPKCQPPAPLYCKDECCPNNYYCECKDWGGFCLPEGAEMCDCEDKSWCEPLQECIDDKGCHEELVLQGKPPCKPLGAEDCPETEGCYCNPGYICTHESPACCASDEPVPCGDYCCPDKNECLTDIQDCLAPGWDYCEAWGTKCGVGLACKQVEPGCKNDDEEECEYGGVICGATEDCVGEGKGKDGCCPTNNPIACDGYCCPKDTHCEPGCGGCVVDGYKCCEDGQTECLKEQVCWKGGAPCLAGGSQDCGSYWCGPEYVCSAGPQQCCAGTMPQTCGSQCCHAYETCYEAGSGGICVDVQGDEEYCGNFQVCGPNTNCCGKFCISNDSECFTKKDNTTHCYCESGKKSFFIYVQGTPYSYHCIPDQAIPCNFKPWGTAYGYALFCPPGCYCKIVFDTPVPVPLEKCFMDGSEISCDDSALEYLNTKTDAICE